MFSLKQLQCGDNETVTLSYLRHACQRPECTMGARSRQGITSQADVTIRNDVRLIATAQA